jgi:hypothetical protein
VTCIESASADARYRFGANTFGISSCVGDVRRVMLPDLTSFGFGRAQARKRQKLAPSPVESLDGRKPVLCWVVRVGNIKEL